MANPQYNLGVGRVYRAPGNTAEPALSTTAPGTPWRDVGDTLDGVTVTIGREFEEYATDQSVGFVKRVLTGQSITVATIMADSTIANIALAMNSATITVALNLSSIPLDLGAAFADSAIVYRWQSPNYEPGFAQLWLPVVNVTGDIELGWTVDGINGVPLEMSSVKDATNGYGRLTVMTGA